MPKMMRFIQPFYITTVLNGVSVVWSFGKLMTNYITRKLKLPNLLRDAVMKLSDLVSQQGAVEKYVVMRNITTSHHLVRTLIFVSIMLNTLTSYAKQDEQNLADWTVMVYMNGDNNLEQNAIDNFNDMSKIGSTDKVNIIVQFDRIAKYGHTTPDWSQTLRFRVTQGMQPLPANAVQDIGEANMGDQKVLSDFVAWAMQKYPAKHYMLDIWDHGAGYRFMFASLSTQKKILDILKQSPENHALINPRSPSPRVSVAVGDPFRSGTGSPYRTCSNDETNNDELYNREIQDGLTSILGSRKLDLIGFDCCLMSMIETAFALRSLSTVFVGSEELEPGPGWQYDDWLRALVQNSNADAKTLGTILVGSYEKAYGGADGDPTTTMCALDLTLIQSCADQISLLANALSNRLPKELKNIQDARASCSNFAPLFSKPNPFYHIDFIRFCQNLSQSTADAEIKALSTKTADLLTSAVIKNYRGMSRQGSFGANGIAIYFPPSNLAYRNDVYAKNGYEKSNTFYPVEFVKVETWSDFLHNYYKYK